MNRTTRQTLTAELNRLAKLVKTTGDDWLKAYATERITAIRKELASY